MASEEIIKKWNDIAKEVFLGRTITGVRYMNDKEEEEMGWNSKALILSLKGKDGSVIHVYPSADDEGNDAGALFTTHDTYEVLPVI